MTDKPNEIHHITCLSGDAQKNYDFYTDVLCLDLVKKTVNHDDPKSYHLYYGDKESPEDLLTFFVIPGLRPGKTGQGAISNIKLRIPEGSIQDWKETLEDNDIVVDTQKIDAGQIRFSDPEGLHIILEEEGEGEGITGVKGFHYHSRKPESSVNLFNRLGLETREETSGHTIVESETTDIKVLKNFNIPLGFRGSGSVHHIAFRTKDEQTHKEWKEKLQDHKVSDITDRIYFKSIYVKDKGNLLVEIATDGPGLHVDEETLGSKLVLPDWLEQDREEIEDELPDLQT